MNKKLFLSALASTALLASCVENDLGSNENLSGNGVGDGRISFTQRTENSTRAVERAEKSHYEFGVNTYLGKVDGTNTMPNFLVGYASSDSEKDWYSDRADVSKAQTWGNAESGDLTDAANNVSSWVYEMMGRTELNNTNSSMEKQSLKYWDESFDNHIFVAYTPYLGNTNNTKPMNSFTVTANTDNKKADVQFETLSSFYTSPVDQTTGARTLGLKTSGANYDASASIATNDKELINANEALYAYTNVEKSSGKYGKDVPLTFKHVNAKVNIRFYETIKGYTVQILDVVPSTAIAKNTALTLASGIQFSPSTDAQGRQPMTQKQTTNLPTYHEVATVNITDISAVSPDFALSGNDGVKTNLKFKQPTSVISETGGASATPSPTTLYVLPNVKGTSYITNTYTATSYEDYQSAGTSTPSTQVGDVTGYTLHVSYKLIPDDGTTALEVYDARVHVDAQFCKWEAGKAYTYIFKITDQSNGTTDPNKADPATTTEPWIDPTDPRVPDDPALKPIVFDGVLVTNYDEVPTGKENYTDEWVITDPSSWTAKSSVPGDVKVGPALLSTAQYTEALGLAWTTAYTAKSNLSATYDKATSKFTVSYDGHALATWPAAVQEKMTDVSGVTFKYNTTDISPAITEVDLYSYSAWLWSNDAATQAMKINVLPSSVTYAHKDVVQKYYYNVDHAKIVYVKTTDTDPSTYYKDKDLTISAPTPNLTEWTLDATTTKYYGGTITYATPTVADPAAHTGNAYAVVKAKP